MEAIKPNSINTFASQCWNGLFIKNQRDQAATDFKNINEILTNQSLSKVEDYMFSPESRKMVLV